MHLFEIIDDAREIVDFINYQRRVYTICVQVDHMNVWDDEDFRAIFRISKDVYSYTSVGNNKQSK